MGTKKGIQEKVQPSLFFRLYEIPLATPMDVLCTRPPVWIHTTHCKPAWRLQTSHSHIKSIKKLNIPESFANHQLPFRTMIAWEGTPVSPVLQWLLPAGRSGITYQDYLPPLPTHHLHHKAMTTVISRKAYPQPRVLVRRFEYVSLSVPGGEKTMRKAAPPQQNTGKCHAGKISIIKIISNVFLTHTNTVMLL